MYYPLNYDKLNLYEGTFSNSTAKLHNNYSFDFWCRSLFQRASSSLEFNLPDEWTNETKDFFIYCIFRFGYVCTFNENEFGFSFQPCTLNGYGFYYQPTMAIVSNPMLFKEFKIHEDCELIKLTPDYMGIWDIIEYFAIKLSQNSAAIDMNMENTKLAYVVAGKTKSAIATLKKIFDKISKGESTVVFDGRTVSPESDVEPVTWLTRDIKNTYVTDSLLTDNQTLISMFDREIGIPTVPYEKKERMVDYEAKSTFADSTSRLTVWLNSLNESMRVVNEHFNTNISVKSRFDIDALMEGGGVDESSDNDTNRPE